MASKTEKTEDFVKPERFSSIGLERLLTKLNYCDEATLAELKERQLDKKLIAALCQETGQDEGKVLQHLAKTLKIPLLTLNELKRVDGSMEIQRLCSKEFMLRQRCIVLGFDDSEVEVAIADPLDFEVLKQIEFFIHRSTRILLAAEADILRAIAEVFMADRDAALLEAAEQEASEEANLELFIPETDAEDGQEGGCEAPQVVQLVNKIMLDAVKIRASDIHLVPTGQNLDVKVRIDGIMSRLYSVPKKLQSFVTARIKLLSGMNLAEHRRPQDGRFRMRLGKGEERDLRISVVPTPFGESAVIRLLRSQAEGVSLDSLELSPELRREFVDMLSGTEQLILVTGPTGSGKTTTLYAAIDHLKQEEKFIVTVEDPIEFRVEGITQIQVDSKIGVTFAAGLRSILRQDPDVILVGEIRDLEAGEIAFQAAQTGHLVLSTLHTNDAPSAVIRLLDLGLEPYVVAASLRAVVAQRLVRKICSNCSELVPLQERREIAQKLQIDPTEIRRGRGCDQCRGTGYRGRSGIFSILHVNRAIREAIKEGVSAQELEQVSHQEGMRSLAEVAKEIVARGVTTYDEIIRVLGGEHGDQATERPVAARKTTAKSPSALTKDREDKVARVMVVDDDHGVRSVIAEILRRNGFDVVEAEGVDSALRELDLGKVDVAIVDVMMPGRSGAEFVKSVRSRNDKLPIMMLTASDDEANEIELLEAGADDFISKTSSPKLVISRLKKLIKKAGISQQN